MRSLVLTVMACSQLVLSLCPPIVSRASSSSLMSVSRFPATLSSSPSAMLRQAGFLTGGRTPKRVGLYNPQGTIDFPLEDEEVNLDVASAPPPTEGRLDIIIDKEIIRRLDLSPAHAVLRTFVHQIGDNTTEPLQDPRELFTHTVGFVINYERDDPFDPRELSEMSDIRLWFVRLDAAYPWLPVVLDWRAGELARYAAMLVPHQMSRRLGLVFNPEALELFAMTKLFTILPWLKAHNVAKPTTKMNDMMRMLGFSIDDAIYKLIEMTPPP